MKRAPLSALVLGLTASLTGFTAFRDPNREDAVRWTVATVEVSIQEDGSDDIGDGSDLVALRAAIRTWAEAADGLSLQEGPTSTSRGYGADGINRLTFIESDWPGGADSALGVTIPQVSVGDPSLFTDMDVLLNGSDGPWTTDGDPSGIDVRSVATHELGHLLGLWHAFHAETVMYFGARAGTTFRRALSEDDRRGARWITSGGLGCDGAGGCPLLVERFGGEHLRLTCQGGSCLPGAAAYGAECISDGHCQSGLCQNDPWTGNGRDPGVCTQACTVGAGDCPGGELCKDDGAGVKCVPGRECLDDADCGGGANDHCLFDFDGHYRCRRICMQDSHCVAPARCVDLGYGAGVCVAPGPAPNGAVCLDPLLCAGLACRGGAETLSCETASPIADGGVVPDIPSVPDGGWRPDGAGVDRAHVVDGGESLDATPDASPEPQRVGEGCACAGVEVHATPWLPMLLGLLVWRRRSPGKVAISAGRSSPRSRTAAGRRRRPAAGSDRS